MSRRRIVGAFVALSIAAAPTAAQSLADVARQEEARRATAPKASKSYSNESLGPDAVIGAVTVTAEPEVSCYMSVKSGRCVTADEIIANTALKIQTAANAVKEPIVRQQADSIREELAWLEQEIDVLTEQEANDHLPAAKRQLAGDALAMKRPQFEHAQQQWAKLERMVEVERYPHDWIEPVPPQARNPR